jgi:hypothetical protein
MHLQLPEKMERVFWKFAIPALSHNPLLRKTVQVMHSLTQDKETTRAGLFLGAGALAGFICGALVYWISLP